MNHQTPPSAETTGSIPEPLHLFLNRGGAGNPILHAFAGGLGRTVDRHAEDETGPRDGTVVVWGVLRGSDRVVEYARASGGHFLYIDHAYFSRGHYLNYRITHNRHEAGPVRVCPPDRIAAHAVDLRPWNRNGRHILVCPPTEHFVKAHRCEGWLDRTLEELRQVTDRPLVVRVKPQKGMDMPSLPEALADAHALVTHSSNVAVEAVTMGTPVFVSTTSAAAPVGLTALADIERPVYPDRRAWLSHLGYSQFSMDELKSGEAWRLLREWETRPFAPVERDG
ncbi:hypothetical protein [Methylobacterium oryzihabitans]|uniref:Uncharacterized protein n=1 Tax=Methylobacterium oryzihabitans TaxID=2499852 RepID=A0A437PH76_9HYPH|nr:hypothetical protein [Methylobacterium oryzihabitans]RVU21631.1 hypothetical protein EOE48_00805 [Methylobacterium oryzihabitans]